MRERLVYAAYSLGWAVVRLLPERLAYRLFELIADLLWRRRIGGVRQLEANLRRARPEAGERELRALSRAGMRTYFAYWCDAFRLPDWDERRTVDSVRMVDEHLLRDAVAAGRGVVAALPHMGNWDHAGAWACRTGTPVVTVAERLRPERLFERFVAFRESLGMRILPLTGGEVDVADALAAHLRAGGLVCLLADRDLTAAGIEVQLLGEPTRFPAGPAVLALRTGAPLMPVTMHTEGRTLVVRLHPYVTPPATGRTREKVTAMTQGVADAFGEAIRAHPGHWHMLQRLWLADLPAARREALGQETPR